MALDAAALRAEFPLLATDRPNGRRVHYLDSAATSQKPQCVLDAMDAYYRETNANVHRGVYEMAAEATRRFEAGRTAAARLVNHPREGLVLTKNATEAINLVAWAWGVRTLVEGDEIVITEMEHHSNIVPWQIVATLTGACVRFVPVTPGGEIDMDALRGLIGGRTRMVGVVHVSNVLGTINPVEEIVAMAHEAGALTMVDATQSVPHMPVDAAAIGSDFLVFTGHKMCGPTGIGCLAGAPSVLGAMEPFLGGGEMISNVTTEGSTWAEIPLRFEAGTPPIAESVGLGAAVEFLESVGMDWIRDHERATVDLMLAALGEVPGLTILGPTVPDRRGAPVSFILDGVHPHDVAQFLDSKGICVRAGHHCAKPLMRALGTQSTTRASAYLYTTDDDVLALRDALIECRTWFGRA
ncbi:MAG: SufS family cysteine desulfurase [Thermoleophilia bacterium]|nr:SufS family cysteine desulfurase [Thermoleophilia bacterium]